MRLMGRLGHGCRRGGVEQEAAAMGPTRLLRLLRLSAENGASRHVGGLIEQFRLLQVQLGEHGRLGRGVVLLGEREQAWLQPIVLLVVLIGRRVIRAVPVDWGGARSRRDGLGLFGAPLLTDGLLQAALDAFEGEYLPLGGEGGGIGSGSLLVRRAEQPRLQQSRDIRFLYLERLPVMRAPLG